MRKFFNEPRKKYAAGFALLLVIAVLCELFVFNYKWIGSVLSEPIAATARISGAADGTIDADTAVLKYENLNEEIKYIRITPMGVGDKAQITVSARDEANGLYLSAPDRTVLHDVKRSQYIRLHFSGKIEDLKIQVSGLNGRQMPLIELNTRVPLMFSWTRLLCVVIFSALMLVLRPGSEVYRIKADFKSNKQRAVVLFVLIIQAVLLFSMIRLNTTALSWHINSDNHKQYYSVIESFKQGKLDIGNAPEELAALENPYDYRTRVSEGVPYKWDHAYFEGKYYSYFGVLPALTIYLPYNLLTGQNLPNYTAVFILGVAFIAGVMYLLKEIIKKWYKDTPFCVYLLLSVVFAWAAVLGYAVYKPDFYIVPPLMALVLSVFGVGLWVSAETEDKKLIPWRLALGSLCVALTAACRPQFLLAAVLGVLLFWRSAFSDRLLFSKRSARQTVAVCAPFVIVGALVMWYNFARFGSPFDFGANYNLTTNDMTSRGMVWGRTGLGIFTYLFQPIRVGAVFPFLHDFSVETTYQGLTLTENLMGGVLWLYPVLCFGIYGAFNRKLFADARVHRLVCACVIMAAVLCVLDAQMAGLLTRYFADFVWLLMVAAALCIFALVTGAKNKNSVHGIVVMLSVVTAVLTFLSIFAHTENAIQTANPEAFYNIMHLIAFWA